MKACKLMDYKVNYRYGFANNSPVLHLLSPVLHLYSLETHMLNENTHLSPSSVLINCELEVKAPITLYTKFIDTSLLSAHLA
jgi:hypothetical protein